MLTLQELTMPGVVNQLIGDVPAGMSQDRLLAALMQLGQRRRRPRITPQQAAVREAQSMRTAQNILMAPQLLGTYGKGGTMPRLGSAQAPFTGFHVAEKPIRDWTPEMLAAIKGFGRGDQASPAPEKVDKLQEAISAMAAGKRKRAATQYTEVATKKARERLSKKVRGTVDWLGKGLQQIAATASLAAPPTTQPSQAEAVENAVTRDPLVWETRKGTVRSVGWPDASLLQAKEALKEKVTRAPKKAKKSDPLDTIMRIILGNKPGYGPRGFAQWYKERM